MTDHDPMPTQEQVDRENAEPEYIDSPPGAVVDVAHCERDGDGFGGCDLGVRIYADGAVWFEGVAQREWKHIGDVDMLDRDQAIAEARALAGKHIPAAGFIRPAPTLAEQAHAKAIRSAAARGFSILDPARIEQMVTFGSLQPDILTAHYDACDEDARWRGEPIRYDLPVAYGLAYEVDDRRCEIEAACLREAATRVRAIRTLADFDARTTEIAAQSTTNR